MTLPELIKEFSLPPWIKDLILLLVLLVGIVNIWEKISQLCRATVNRFKNLYAWLAWKKPLYFEADIERHINIWNDGELDISDIEVFIWDVESKQRKLFRRKSLDKPTALKKGEYEPIMLHETFDSFTATTLVFIFYPVLGRRKRWVGECFPATDNLSYYRSDFEEFEKGFGDPSALARKLRWLPRKTRKYIYGKACKTGFVPSPSSPYVRLKNKKHMEKVGQAIPALVDRLHRELDADKLEKTEENLRKRQEEKRRQCEEKEEKMLQALHKK